MLATGGTLPSQNNTVEKWCYSNSSANCNTDGGLYTWAEANQLTASCNSASCTTPAYNQGICPALWHIPTDNEFKTLEMFLGMTQTEADNTGWRGDNQGTQLKVVGANAFSAIFAGYRAIDNTFSSRGSDAHFWLASQNSATLGWRRHVAPSLPTVYRSGAAKENGLSVRCLRN